MEGATTTTTTSKVPKLIGLVNFFEWRIAVEDAVLAVGAEEALTDDPPIEPREIKGVKPSYDDSREWRAWKLMDQKARAIILPTLSHGGRLGVVGCKTAKQVWNKLIVVHEIATDQFRADVTRDILTLRFGPSDDPDAFMERFQSLMFRGITAELPMEDADQCKYFNNALSSSFETMKLEWRSLKEGERTFMSLQALFNQHIAARSRDAEIDGISAMYVKARKPANHGASHGAARPTNPVRKTIKCWNCGKTGHGSYECRGPKIGNGETHKAPMTPRFGGGTKGSHHNKSHQATQGQDDLAAYLGGMNMNTMLTTISKTSTSQSREVANFPIGENLGDKGLCGDNSWPTQVLAVETVGLAREEGTKIPSIPVPVSFTTPLSYTSSENCRVTDSAVFHLVARGQIDNEVDSRSRGYTEHVMNRTSVATE